jgi:nitrite reductase/ring-hydroxylating ferredoxin subunit
MNATLPAVPESLAGRLASRLESLNALDPLVGRVGRWVDASLPSRRWRDLLHGVPLGHPAHPALTDVPIGAFVSVAVLDAVPGTGPAVPVLLATGLIGALPAAASGWADWSTQHEQQKRVGLVHAVANVAALGCYTASLVRRMRGLSGKTWSYAGLTLAGAGGYLGGHLTGRQAAGANHVEDVPHRISAGWHAMGPLAELPLHVPTRRSIDGVDVVVVRQREQVQVLAGLCSHLSGPLWEGEFADGCLKCPWHGSVFRLEDGGVQHGPATSPQPRFRTRVREGQLEACLPGAG